MDASVIVPLYVYPALGAWDSVFTIASSYPRIQFTTIVNIGNGPGQGALPNERYSQAIATLNSLSNVRTIGYVATTWCARNLSSVLDDIAAYSFWGEHNSSLAMEGLFLDETPTQFSPDSASYLETISKAVAESPGLRDDYIVHNPGALPEAPYFDGGTGDQDAQPGTNLTVVFENSYTEWGLVGSTLAENTKLYDRNKLAVFIHSLPDMLPTELETTVRQLLTVGSGIWLTGTSNYTEFDDHFPAFVSALAGILQLD